ncbi:hypothetical protein BC832DRAFT_591282 [Gaertneriomyces semiglobifer]|nr:hypothetical protein BC832DRAFT_591282 [Gaertneriomyces semiglobifer]
MDWLTGTIYCTHCKDYAYDLDFERAMRSEQDRMDMIISRIKEPNAKRLRLMEWNPSQQEVDTIQQKSTLMDCSGLRGFYNLGNTCFMSSILQTMIHNPLLKFYFLSDKHNRGLCPKRNHNCMACQLDTVFHEFYSGQTKPYGPASFLHAMWMSQKHMAGYSQQDAHEFFISLANEIHNNCAAERDMLHVRGCKCIVHQTFAGLLQSDVTCSSCQNVSTAHDPMLDLSLEVKRRPKSGKHKPNTADKKAPSGVNGTTEDPATVPKAEAIKDTGLKKVAKGKIKESLDVCTLGDCLDGFTVPEKLEYTCSSCHECKEATKQMSVKKLPPVLSIQLKRFEHSAKSSSSSKIDAIVKVPAELDMTPYTTRAIKLRNKLRGSSAGRKGSKIGAITESPMDGIPSYKYSLFAVVSHTGKLETGHYTTYAKVREQWFAFDDHNVTLADQKEVLEGNGYMCFYLRNGHQYSYSARGGSAANGDVVDLTTSPSKGDNRPNGI